jgi:hypothetical protein
MRELAAADVVGRHCLADTAEDATMLLFPDAHLHEGDLRLSAIRDHPLARRYPERALAYDETDRPWRHLPGVYVSHRADRLLAGYQVAWGYYSIPDRVLAPSTAGGRLLFSFMGSPTAPVRERVFALRHPRACVERVDGFTFYDPGSIDFAARQERFSEVLAQSIFVLCPRGGGLSSIRLYETMAAGRVPVIIADGWAPPIGPDWSRFCVQVPERDVAHVPALLESIEHRAGDMAAAARAAYDTYFAPPRAFHNLVERLALVVGVPRHVAPIWDRSRVQATEAFLIGRARRHAGALRDRLRP